MADQLNLFPYDRAKIHEQYVAMKAHHPTTLLLMRAGDFYEAFGDDAELLSRAMGLHLQHVGGIPMCGVPFHALDGYCRKLIAYGLGVAVAEPGRKSDAL